MREIRLLTKLVLLRGVLNDAIRALTASSSGLSRVHVLSNHSEKEGRLLVSSEEPTGLEHCQRDLHPKTIVTPIYLYIWRTNEIRFASWSTSGHIRNEEQRGSLAGVKHYPTNACPYGDSRAASSLTVRSKTNRLLRY